MPDYAVLELLVHNLFGLVRILDGFYCNTDGVRNEGVDTNYSLVYYRVYIQTKLTCCQLMSVVQSCIENIKHDKPPRFAQRDAGRLWCGCF